MLRTHSLYFAALAAASLAFTTGAHAQSAGPLAVEDFEAANVASGGLVTFIGPLSSTSSNAAFKPGDILPGLFISDPNGGRLVAAGTGAVPGASKQVGEVVFGDPLLLTFTGGGNAVTFNLDASTGRNNITPAVFTVSVFGSNGLLYTAPLTTTTANPIGFFGAVNPTGAITSISIVSDASAATLVDNIGFVPSAAPEPSQFAAFAIGLLGLGALAVKSRKRAA